MAKCEYCNEVSTCTQECSVCGEVLVEGANVSSQYGCLAACCSAEAADEFDGQPDERQEWDDFMGGDEYYDHSEYEHDCDCVFDY